MTQDAQQLLPCPFCGGEAELKIDTIDVWLAQRLYTVECSNGECLAVSDRFAAPERATAWWNRRAESAELAALRQQVTQLEAQLATATITADQRGSLIGGMEEAIDEMQEEINTLSYCEACGGEMMIEATWEMPNAAGGYRKIPCTRCDGTGREYVPRLTARIAELEVQLAVAQEWEPVADGDITSFLSIQDGGETIGVFAGEEYSDWYATEHLPDDVRLCRRTPAAGE